MQNRLVLGAVGLGIAVSLGLAGCVAPPIMPPTDGPAPNSDVDGMASDTPATPDRQSMVDPAWPWPADTPRPANIVSEFTSGNPLGEGGVWEISFTVSSLEEAQAYIDTLIASGWESFLGSEPLIEDGSAVWSLVKEDRLGAVSIDDLNASPIEVSFGVLGE